jgi:glutathione S-transferase
MSMIDPAAGLAVFAYRWVPDFAQGYVRDLRPRWACEEAGIPYREHLIDVMDKPASYFAEQPWGQVPALLDGDVRVFESGATLLHLGEKSETLLPPGGQARATAMSWLLGAVNTVEPVLMELTNVNVFATGEQWTELRRPSLEAFVGRRLKPVEARVGSQDWLGDGFSIADIAMVTVLRELDNSPLLEEHPAIGAYIERGMDRAAFRQAIADQLAAFARHPQPRKQEA